MKVVMIKAWTLHSVSDITREALQTNHEFFAEHGCADRQISTMIAGKIYARIISKFEEDMLA